MGDDCLRIVLIPEGKARLKVVTRMKAVLYNVVNYIKRVMLHLFAGQLPELASQSAIDLYNRLPLPVRNLQLSCRSFPHWFSLIVKPYHAECARQVEVDRRNSLRVHPKPDKSRLTRKLNDGASISCYCRAPREAQVIKCFLSAFHPALKHSHIDIAALLADRMASRHDEIGNSPRVTALPISALISVMS